MQENKNLELTEIDYIIYKQILNIQNNLSPTSSTSQTSSSLSEERHAFPFNNNLIKIVTTDKLKTSDKVKYILEKSESEYMDEEEEYVNKIGDDKAADLYLLQENLHKLSNSEIPLRFQILESSMPDKIKSRILRKYEMTLEMNTNGEYFKNMRWIEGVLKIPFNKYKCENMAHSQKGSSFAHYISESKKILDDCIYGHFDCKNYIIQILAQYFSKNTSNGKVFGIQGPPGNGKTSLIKNGICKVLNRPFSMITLGGIKDGSLLEGHDFTYEGSQWGRLVQCLIDAECMNPVIYFDELDKVSETMDGQEIIGILTHLVDFTQNDRIQDRYFNGIDLDFSKCIFIFSFNDESKLNAVLKDRIQIFHTKGFTEAEKVVIAEKYLLPQICGDFVFTAADFIFSRELLLYVIKKYTNHEEGVREIKKKLELILLKFNLDYLSQSVQIPFEMNHLYIDDSLKKYSQDSTIANLPHMYL